MSCKGILPQTRNGSGQIEDECKKGLSDPLCFLKNREYGFTISDPILPDSNQDVADECSNGENISSGVLEIASSANFILSSTQVTSDVVGISVDDWFKHKSDGSMDLDSVLTTDGIEVNDLEAYHFATSKDNVDMCIVTNICDMGLGFDLPVNICDKCNRAMGECDCDCDETVVNEFVETSFLEDYKSEKEKSMLIKLNKPKLNEKRDTFSEKEKEIADSYIVQLEDKEVKETNSKDCDWNQGEDVYDHSHPVVLNGEKVSWESLSSVSQHSTDYESEKDLDFSEFSLLTFQVENSEGVNVINTLSQIDSVSDNDVVPGNVIVSEGCILPENVSLVESCNSEPQITNTSDLQVINTSKENCTDTNSAGIIETMCNALDLQTEPPREVESSPATVIEKNNNSLVNKGPSISHSTTHPRSVLRPSQKVASKSDSSQTSLLENHSRTSAIVRSDQESSTQPNGTKKPPSVTIIAISTDKSKNTTEIVINTSQGEQKFKGKTTDFIKATSKLCSSKTVKAKIGKSLNLSNVEVSREEPTATQTELESDWLRYEKNKAADEQPITEALAALGVDMSSVACVTTSGYKLWSCPTLDCDKLYPRLSLLKVHILTHFGVRPYRCDVPGCDWTFYTFFKLKRHKETHLKKKSFVCPDPNCGHRFTTIYNLKTHRKLHERPAKLKCPVVGCDALFQTKRAVELHIRKHGISHAPYQCVHAGCGKRYYSSNTLQSHARSHQHREEEVRCQWPDCGKWFDKPCRLKAHMRTHTGDKPYLCTFQNCGWAFSSASKLKRHQQKHTNERKFRCDFEGCGKSFMRSEHLREHIQTHIGERSYQCNVANCGVKFTAKSSLYVHLKKHKQQLNETGASREKQPATQFQVSNSGQLLQQQQQPQQLQQQQQQQQQRQQQQQQQRQQQQQQRQQKQQQRQQKQQQRQQPQQQQQQQQQIQQQQQPKSKQEMTRLVAPKLDQIGNGEPLQVILPASGNTFQCPVESCAARYNCKTSLRQHLMKHLPVLASDTGQLDFVTSLLLSGSSNQQVLVSPSDDQPVVSSDGLATVSVQGPVCTVAVTGADLNSSGLLTTNSLFDPGTTFSSEYVLPEKNQSNTEKAYIEIDDRCFVAELLNPPEINNMLVVSETADEAGARTGNSVLLTSDSAADPTVSDPETELHLATESIGDPLLVGNLTHRRAVSFGLGNISGTEEDEIADDPTCQAARTNLTYRDVMHRKRLPYYSRTASSAGVKTIGRSCDNGGAVIGRRGSGTCNSEPALADAIVGLRDPVTALCLPPDMAGFVAPTTDLNLLLQEESGYQVLLLDGEDSQFYTESTINLRDLE